MAYPLFKFLHLLGIVLLIGNVTVTAVWKVFADRTGEASTIAFAQRLVTGTDWAFTGSGIVLTMIGGYGMMIVADFPLFDYGWLLWSQVLFLLSGLIWLCVLLPIQIKQARLARDFSGGGEVGARYRRLAIAWIWAGIAATIPLALAMYLMVAKRPI